MQIFANPECTEYPTGEIPEGGIVYARINIPWGFDEDWRIQNIFYAYGAGTEYPTDPYGCIWYEDFQSEEYHEPLSAGQVIQLIYQGSGTIDVTNYIKVITKP